MGGIGISVTLMTPGEKSEHLIYAILPLSVALYFIVQWEVTALSLALASLTASFLALFLLELSIDESIVKGVFRRLSGESYGFQKRRFVLWNMFSRSWEYELTSFDSKRDENKLEKEISQMSQAAISSSLIRPRLWRLRAEIYFIASLYFLVPTASLVVDKLVVSEIIINSSWFVTFQGLAAILNQIGWCVTLLLMVIIGVAAWYRHRHLSNHIRYLSQFRYLQRNLYIKRMKHELDEHSESEDDRIQQERAVLLEIELQNEFLLSRDWSFFIDRCDRWSRELSRIVTDDIEKNGMFYLLTPWAVLASTNIREEVVDKQLRAFPWVHYYFTKLIDYKETYVKQKEKHEIWKSLDDDDYPNLEESSFILIDHIGELIEKGYDIIKNPNELLETLVMLPPGSKSFLAVLWSIAGYGLHYGSALGKGLLQLLVAFNTKNKTGFDRIKAAKAIIHVFKGHVPKKLSIWGEGDTPFCRLSNIIKTIGCDTADLSPVVQHFIENCPGASLQKVKSDPEVLDCITKLGLEDKLRT